MLTANVLAKKTNLPIYTVRHYTRIGLLHPMRNLQNGYRIYKPSDAARLKFIVAAKNLGFTLTEISNILKDAHKGESPCPSVRIIIAERIKETRLKIKSLQILQKKMEDAVKNWDSLQNSVPDGDSVCRLIESVGEAEL